MERRCPGSVPGVFPLPRPGSSHRFENQPMFEIKFKASRVPGALHSSLPIRHALLLNTQCRGGGGGGGGGNLSICHVAVVLRAGVSLNDVNPPALLHVQSVVGTLAVGFEDFLVGAVLLRCGGGDGGAVSPCCVPPCGCSRRFLFGSAH